VASLVLFVHLLWTPLGAWPVPRQLQTLRKFTQVEQKTASATKSFSIAGNGEARFDLKIGATGKI